VAQEELHWKTPTVFFCCFIGSNTPPPPPIPHWPLPAVRDLARDVGDVRWSTYDVSVLKLSNVSFRGKCARMGNTLKLPSPTKLTRLGHFPPASKVGRPAGPVFYVYVFSLAITFSVARYLSSLFILSFRCVESRVLLVPAESLGGGAKKDDNKKNFRPLHIFVIPMLLGCFIRVGKREVMIANGCMYRGSWRGRGGSLSFLGHMVFHWLAPPITRNMWPLVRNIKDDVQ
jgi:hypothetical protein